MNLYRAQYTHSFKKQLKKVLKQPGHSREDIARVINLLIQNAPLPSIYNDHKLKGDYEGHRELHVKPDWILIYRINDNLLVLTIVATGSHADVFGM